MVDSRMAEGGRSTANSLNVLLGMMPASSDQQPDIDVTVETRVGGPSPEDLLERVARGDRGALLGLYDRYAGTLLAVALRITSVRAEAEDVLQEALVRAWRESSGFDRSRGTAIAWLITLTRNRAIDVVRARRRRLNHEDEAVDLVEMQPQRTPEGEMVDAERAAAVQLALEVLKVDQRRVLDLAYFSGLSHTEIAERLGQPLGTVKTRIAQAVKKLRDELARFAPTPGREGQAGD